MKKGKLIGYRRFTSKAGKRCDLVHILVPMEKRDNDIVLKGEEVISFYLDDALLSKVTLESVGKEVEFRSVWTGKGNYLIDIEIK